MATIDERVVEMRFDNGQFEKGTKESIKSIDELEKKLQFKEAGEGLTFLGAATQQVALKFDLMSAMAITALTRMTNSAIDAGERMIKSLTVDQITAGWQKYADKTSAVQTIMAATANQFSDTGEQMAFVNEQLDKLNWFTDETSYNFVDMVSNIGKFTSNAVDLETAVTSMQGIAVWAAKSGANAQEASRAMYNLSQAIAVGTVKLIDWKSIENANMATAEFKQTAIDTAVALGQLKQNADGTFSTLKGNTVSVSNFNDALSDAWFTSEVLLQTLDKYGGFTNKLNDAVEETGIVTSELIGYIDKYRAGTLDLARAAEDNGVSVEDLSKHLRILADDSMQFGLSAFKAAQEAKTFREAIDATADAVSSGWMKTFEIIFGDYEQAKELWTDLSLVLYDMFALSGEYRNEMLEVWNDLGGREAMLYGIAEAFEAIKSIVRPLAEGIREIFPKDDAEDAGNRLFQLTMRFAEFFDGLRLNEQRASQYQRIFRGLASAIDIVLIVIKQLVNAFGGPLLTIVAVVLNVFIEIIAIIGDCIYAFRNFVAETNLLQAAMNILALVLTNLWNMLVELWNTPVIQAFVRSILQAFTILLNALGPVVVKIAEAIQTFLNRIAAMQKLDFKELYLAFGELLTNIVKAITSIELNFAGLVKNIANVFSIIINTIKDFISWITINGELLRLDRIFGLVYVAAVIGALIEIRKGFIAIGQAASTIGKSFGGVTSGATGVLNETKNTLVTYQKEINSKSLVNIAIAVGVFAASIALLSFLDLKKLAIAAGVILALSAALVAMSKFISTTASTKAATSFTKLAFGVTALAAAFMLLVAALDKLKEVSLEEIGQGLLGFLAIAGVITAASVAMSKLAPNMSSGSIFLISFALSMKSLISVIKDISTSDISLSGDTIKALIVMIGLLAILAKVCQKTSEVSSIAGLKSKASSGVDAFGLLAMVISIQVLVSALKKLGNMDYNDIKNGLSALIPIMATFGLLMVATKLAGENASKAGTGLLAMSAALVVLTLAVKSFSKIGTAEIKKAEGAIAGILSVFSLVIVATKFAGEHAAKAGVTLLAMSAAITLLVAPIMILSGIEESALDSATNCIFKIGIMFTAVIAATKLAQDASKTIQAMTVTLIALTAALAILAIIDPAGMGRATAAIDSLILCFSLLIASTKLMSDVKTVIPNLAVMTLVVAAITGLLAAMTYVPYEGMLERSTAISEVLAVMVGCVVLLGKTKTNVSTQALASLAAVTAVVAAIGLIITLMSQYDMSEAITIATALSEIMIAVGVALAALAFATKVQVDIKKAIELGLAFDAFVAIVGSLLGIASLIGSQEGALDAVQNGVKLIGSIGEAIGNFFGGIIGGVIGGAIEGVSNALPQIGRDLTSFMEEAEGFFDGISAIDSDVLEGVANLAKAFLTITAAEVINGLTSFITGGAPLTKFGKELASFGPDFADFANDMATIKNTEALVNATEAAKVVAEFANAVPNSGGALGLLVGENELSKFGEELELFAPHFVAYANAITAANIDNDVVTATSAVIQSVVDFANEVPNTGGALSWFVGNNDLSEFGKELYKFTPYFVMYAKVIANANIDAETVETTNRIIETIINLAKDIPNYGGVLAGFFGDNDIGKFGESLKTFGAAFYDYAETIGEINTSDVEKTTPIIQAIVDMANTLPEAFGLLDIFGGGNTSLVTFGTNLSAFGGSVKAYSKSVAEVDTLKIEQVTKGINGVIDLVKRIEQVDLVKMHDLPKTMESVAKDSVKLFVETFNNAVPEAEKAGKNLVQGLENGVNSRKANVKSLGTQMATTYLNAFREAAGIQSPSKETAEDGDNLVAGLLNSVSSKAKDVYESGKNTANNFLSGLNSTLDISNGFSNISFESGLAAVFGFEMGADSEHSNLLNTITNITQEVTAPFTAASTSTTSIGSTMVDNLATGISSNKSAEKAAQTKAEAIVSVFEDTLSRLDLSMTTYDLEYKLWSAANELTASDTEKMSAELANLAQNLQAQAEKTEIVREEYEKIREAYGDDATETIEAYNKLLQEQTKVHELTNQITTLQNQAMEESTTSVVDQEAARKAYTKFLNEEAGLLLQQGFTLDEVKRYASKISGYDLPGEIETNQNGVKTAIEGVSAVANNTWETESAKTTSMLATSYSNMGTTATNSLASAINTTSYLPTNATTDMAAKSEQVIDNQVPIWENGGYNMDEGLAAGIIANGSIVSDAATQIAKDAYENAMAALKASSSSYGALSTAATNVGKYVASGVANGFLEEDYLIYSATGEVSKNMLEAALSYADYINATVSDKLEDFEPSIRPVIDMTDVEASIAAIDAYISHATSASLSLGASERLSQDINTKGYLGIRTPSYTDNGNDGGGGVTVNFTQNNYSPSSLSTAEIYRETSTAMSSISASIGTAASTSSSSSSSKSGSQDIRSDGTIGVKR